MPPIYPLLPVPQVDGYVARRVVAVDARKPYRCPACAGTIAAGEGHVVVWPQQIPDVRRHWHLHCWRVESARGGPRSWR